MGKISRKLVDAFQRQEQKSAELAEQFTAGLNSDVPDLEELLDKGYDPDHALYVIAQNFTSDFAEAISAMDDLDDYANTVNDLDDMYLPQGPPLSPLTTSYFTLWALFDLQFGEDRETVGECLAESLEFMNAPPQMVGVVNNLCRSRMGIYENCGTVGPNVRLRELVTGDEFLCYSTAGYQGAKGELWFARLCPPIAPGNERYVVMTTPYVLFGSSSADWTASLNKSLIGMPGDKRDALRDLFKHGQPSDACSWHEFVFQAYHHSQFDAIFLAGLPDVPSSRPHADLALQDEPTIPPVGNELPPMTFLHGLLDLHDRSDPVEATPAPKPTPAVDDSTVGVRFTAAQRRAIATLHEEWADRLLLDRKNQRTIELTIAELKQLGTSARKALEHATGHQRLSLKRIVAIADKEYTAATAVRVYQFRIELRHTAPPIWRRIQVENCTLEDLHFHIQAAMGWQAAHLYEFRIRDTSYATADGDWEQKDASQTWISDIVPKRFRRFRFTYLYDFGDGWEHIIELEKIPVAETDTRYPVCLDGANACPPEDCGGVWGFYDIVEVITDPEHPEYEERLEWIGEFDPEAFDQKTVTKTMRRWTQWPEGHSPEC